MPRNRSRIGVKPWLFGDRGRGRAPACPPGRRDKELPGILWEVQNRPGIASKGPYGPSGAINDPGGGGGKGICENTAGIAPSLY